MIVPLKTARDLAANSRSATLLLVSLIALAVPALAIEPANARSSAATPPVGQSPIQGELITPFASASDLPPGCSSHWKTPNVRDRRVNRDTYLHQMSANCVPYGPVNGTVPVNSTFRVYFSDPYEPEWCYGYSVNLARKGYVLCNALSVP